MAGRYSSSSSDNDSEGYRSNIQLPEMRLGEQGKSKKPLKKKFGNVTKNKAKTVRFPELYSARDSVMSSSTTNDTGDSESEAEGQEHPQDPVLPSFAAGHPKPPEEKYDKNDQSDSEQEVVMSLRSSQEMSDDNRVDISEKPPPTLQTQGDDPSKLPEEDIQQQKFSLDEKEPDSFEMTDLSHQKEFNGSSKMKKTTTSVSMTSGLSMKKREVFKSILRKLALKDENISEDNEQANTYLDDQANSNTLLGRILNLTGDTDMQTSNNLNKENQDLEKGSDGNISELKKVDLAALGQEARKLIHSHAPNVLPNSADSSDAPGTNNVPASTSENVESRQLSEETQKTGFYVPNPENFLNTDTSGNPDEHLLLDQDNSGDYIAPPKHVQAGVLSSLLKLYQNPEESKSEQTLSQREDPEVTGDLSTEHDLPETENEFYGVKKNLIKGINKGRKKFMGHIPKIGRSHKHKDTGKASEENDGDFDEITATEELPSFSKARPKAPKKTMVKKLTGNKKSHTRANKITVHIAGILQRQKFIIKLCKALMMYGAPTHRLEEYMVMTSRVLEIDGQYSYLPGFMIVAFGDAATRTSEVHLVKCVQGLNLSKLSDTHAVYKGVIHDLMGVEEASVQLDDLIRKRNRYPKWACVFFYGLGASMVTPFAFGGGWVDIPVSFAIGLCVGYLQYFLSSKSNLYSSVFEVAASIVVTFLARAIGTIKHGKYFCFSGIAQGSLALILPGYIILCGSLELQSRNLVAGSVRMFYAIIYSLFLGFGITLGASLFGWFRSDATSYTDCRHIQERFQIDDKFYILFVPLYTIILCLINQARFRQIPIMVIIACVGYVANYFSNAKYFKEQTTFNACIGAFVVGVLGNLYSRIWKGMAVSAMLPGIFILVPSGVASNSSLLSGVRHADEITNGSSSRSGGGGNDSSSLSFGTSMVEVAIGISVGLCAAAIVVYPFGKRKSGLFSL